VSALTIVSFKAWNSPVDVCTSIALISEEDNGDRREDRDILASSDYLLDSGRPGPWYSFESWTTHFIRALGMHVLSVMTDDE